MIKNSGQKLWGKALKIIQGGNMLLSKNPDLHLPGLWPTYFTKAKGCHVWDLNKNKLTDFSFMGIGTNILGYANSDVDNEVIKCIRKSVSSTLNCPEEVELSKMLIEMHPWAQKVKLCRTGAEANSLAIRIARSYAKNSKIAFCGYHGWHDWYMAANLSSKNSLGQHHLSGLSTVGVPKDLTNTIFSFRYNNINELEEIIHKKKIGIVIMEVKRNINPEKKFLNDVRFITKKKDIVLIFDECTSGFRETFGGLHIKYNIEPDISVFGKALGNGYAITAVIGKKKIMDSSKKSFISSTFWSERIGPVAAIKTLEIMKDIKSWKIISTQGKKIKDGLEKLSKKYNLNISFFGLDSLISFKFNHNQNRLFKTFITQEMLKQNYLASTSIYLCIDHSDKLIRDYLNKIEKIFFKLSTYIKKNKIINILNDKICIDSFNRLN